MCKAGRSRPKPLERKIVNYAQLSTKFTFAKLASAPSSTFQGTTSREELTILMRRNFHSHSIFS